MRAALLTLAAIVGTVAGMLYAASFTF